MRPGSPGRVGGLTVAGHNGGFVGWYGPVFWPYAFDDIFLFMFWPSDYSDYDDRFWAYAYLDVADGAFRPRGDAHREPGEAAPPESTQPPASQTRSRSGVRGLEGQSREFARICGQRPPARTSWPVERIARTIQATGAQLAALRELGAAAATAATLLDASCPTEVPVTAMDRMHAILHRLDALAQAVATLRPATAMLWGSFGADQKASFEHPAVVAPGSLDSLTGSPSDEDGSRRQPAPICGPQDLAASRDSLDWIEQVIRPTEHQHALLADLKEAHAKAVTLLRAACPTDASPTPPERLRALAQRLAAMRDAAGLEQAALDAFYRALTSAQQAHLNGIARRAAPVAIR